jgi:hypothetical protein
MGINILLFIFLKGGLYEVKIIYYCFGCFSLRPSHACSGGKGGEGKGHVFLGPV